MDTKIINSDASKEAEIDIKDLLEIFLRRLRIIILITLSVGVIAFLISAFLITPIYSASVTMYVNNTKRSMNDSINYSDITASQMLVNTYMEMIKSNTVLEEVAEKSETGYTEKEISKMLSLTSATDTEIFKISVHNPDPETAVKIANTIAEVAPNKILDYVEASSVKIIDYAKIPETPSSPNIMKNTFAGLMLGFVLSVLLVVMLEMFDTRIKSEEQLEKMFDIPVIGVIPEIIDKTE